MMLADLHHFKHSPTTILSPNVLFTAEMQAISGIMAKMQCKSSDAAEHRALTRPLTSSCDALHLFYDCRVQLQMFNTKRRWESDQKSKTNTRSELLPSPDATSSSREISPVRAKKSNTWGDHLGNSPSPLCLSLELLTGPHQLHGPNSLPGR